MGCNAAIAQAILDAKADYLLAVKDNQPTLHADIKSYFETAPAGEDDRCETLGKGDAWARLRIDTITERHGGPFAGHHARYVLRSRIRVIGADESQAVA